jgi:hypothetical protein
MGAARRLHLRITGQAILNEALRTGPAIFARTTRGRDTIARKIARMAPQDAVARVIVAPL